MPIEYDTLYRQHIVETTADTTIAEICGLFTRTFSPDTYRQWYLLVRLTTPGCEVVRRNDGGYQQIETPPPGYAVVLPVQEFAEAFAQYGDDMFTRALRDVPHLLQTALTIDRDIIGTGRARREWMHQSPRSRLVVLENKQCIGLLTDEIRAGGFGGFTDQLFGQEQRATNVTRKRFIYRCPLCPSERNTYDFVELIDLTTNRLTCPDGHIIQEK